MKKLALFAFFALTLNVCLPRSQAQVSCPAGDDNMLDWMTLDTATTQHLTGQSMSGSALVLYTILPSDGLFWWIKGDHSGEGYPWDVQYYDSTYIYQWITDYDPYSYTDPHYFKSFDSKTGMPWAPICVPAGSPGDKLSSITVPSSQTGYHFYGPNCTEGSGANLNYAVNEVWNYGNLNIDNDTTPPGNLGTHPDLELSYRYSCDSTYNNCQYKEVYDFMQGYGEVRWTYYTLSGGTYSISNQSIFNTLTSGGSPAQDFPCTM